MPPVNDNFAGAIALAGAGGSMTFSNVGATMEPGEPNHAGTDANSSVWFKYTAATDGWLTVDLTKTPLPGWDAVIEAYIGSVLSTLTIAKMSYHGLMQDAAGYNDVDSSTQCDTALRNIKVDAGTTVFLRVDAYADYTPYQRDNAVITWAFVPYGEGAYQTRPTAADKVLSSSGLPGNWHWYNQTSDHVAGGASNGSFASPQEAWDAAINPTHISNGYNPDGSWDPGIAVRADNMQIGVGYSQNFAGNITGTTPYDGYSQVGGLPVFIPKQGHSAFAQTAFPQPPGVDETRPWGWDPTGTVDITELWLILSGGGIYLGGAAEVRRYDPSRYAGVGQFDPGLRGGFYWDDGSRTYPQQGYPFGPNPVQQHSVLGLQPQWLSPGDWASLPLLATNLSGGSANAVRVELSLDLSWFIDVSALSTGSDHAMIATAMPLVNGAQEYIDTHQDAWYAGVGTTVMALHAALLYPAWRYLDEAPQPNLGAGPGANKVIFR